MSGGGYVPRKLRDRSRGDRRPGRDTGSTKSTTAGKKPGTGASSKAGSKRRPSPRGNTGRRPSPTARKPLSAYRRFSLTAVDLRRYSYRMTIAAVVALLFAGLTWVGSGKSGLELIGVFGRTTQQVEDAKKDAETAASAMLSYDYRTFDDSRTNGKAFVTGTFAKQYDKMMDGLEESAAKEKAVVSAEVVDVATVETDASCSPKEGPTIEGGIELLAFVNQSIKNQNIDGTRIDKSRVVLCMAPTDEGWRVAELRAILAACRVSPEALTMRVFLGHPVWQAAQWTPSNGSSHRTSPR